MSLGRLFLGIVFQINYSCGEETSTEVIVYKVSDQVKTCSDWLSDFVRDLCSNVFLIVKRNRRSLMDRLVPEGIQEHVYKHRLVSSEPWRRVRRQIATECCDNPCTIANLILYCPDETRLFKENPDIFYDD